jgi:hypothetical protein
MADPVIYDYDGFEDYATAGILREHVRLDNVPLVTTGGRNGGSWLQCPAGSAVLRAIPGSPFSSVWVGAYLVMDGLPSGSSAFFAFMDPIQAQVMLAINNDGSISAVKMGDTYWWADWGSYPFSWVVLGTTEPGLIQSGVGFFLEAELTVSSTVGTVTLKVNRVQKLALTGQNTQGVNSGTITALLMGSQGVAEQGDVYVDDLWVAAGSLGDRRVMSLFGTAQGTYNAAVPSTPGDHFPLVNEAPEPNDIATYVSLDTPNQRESYLFETFALAPGEAVAAVMEVLDARKSVAGDGLLAGSVRIDGTDYDGPDVGLATAAVGLWPRRKRLTQLSPATGIAWDPATELNPPELGVVVPSI